VTFVGPGAPVAAAAPASHLPNQPPRDSLMVWSPDHRGPDVTSGGDDGHLAGPHWQRFLGPTPADAASAPGGGGEGEEAGGAGSPGSHGHEGARWSGDGGRLRAAAAAAGGGSRPGSARGSSSGSAPRPVWPSGGAGPVAEGQLLLPLPALPRAVGSPVPAPPQAPAPPAPPPPAPSPEGGEAEPWPMPAAQRSPGGRPGGAGGHLQAPSAAAAAAPGPLGSLAASERRRPLSASSSRMGSMNGGVGGVTELLVPAAARHGSADNGGGGATSPRRLGSANSSAGAAAWGPAAEGTFPHPHPQQGQPRRPASAAASPPSSRPGSARLGQPSAPGPHSPHGRGATGAPHSASHHPSPAPAHPHAVRPGSAMSSGSASSWGGVVVAARSSASYAGSYGATLLAMERRPSAPAWVARWLLPSPTLMVWFEFVFEDVLGVSGLLVGKGDSGHGGLGFQGSVSGRAGVSGCEPPRNRC
jgi:hypothetical protein